MNPRLRLLPAGVGSRAQFAVGVTHRTQRAFEESAILSGSGPVLPRPIDFRFREPHNHIDAYGSRSFVSTTVRPPARELLQIGLLTSGTDATLSDSR